jgi:REP element-mobilizing transposase RayT
VLTQKFKILQAKNHDHSFNKWVLLDNSLGAFSPQFEQSWLAYGSYFIASCDGVTSPTLKKYIENQKNPE